MNIINQLFDVLLKKRAPEDVSYSVNAMIVACLLTVLGQYYQLSLIKELSQPVLYAVILTVSQIMAYALLLKLHGKENRLVQTITVVMGISFIILVIMTVLSYIPILSILGIALWGYGIVVTVNVLKSSFNCPTYLAVVIFVSVSVFSILMLFVVAPAAGDEYMLFYENLQAEAAKQQTS